MIGSRFIHLIGTDSNEFLFMANFPLCMWNIHNVFTHSSVDGHLGCFHVLASVSSAAKNIGVHMPFSVTVSSGYICPVMGLFGHTVVLFLVF